MFGKKRIQSVTDTSSMVSGSLLRYGQSIQAGQGDRIAGVARAPSVRILVHPVEWDFNNCRVPCDYIPKRSYPLFQTRQILNDWLTQNLEEA